MMLSELFAGEPVRRMDGGGDVRVCDLTEDSRTVVPGSLFVARRGATDDGSRYAAQAVAAGAVAVLTDNPDLRLDAPHRPALLHATDLPGVCARVAERFYGGAGSKLAVLGVTGTNGKTTTAWLIHQILNDAGVRCGLIGTVAVDDGVELARAEWTTPPSIELSRTLGVMLDAGCRACVMEVSSHALDQQRVAAVSFQVGVFTNLTGDHLDYHGTMERYADAKARLFEMLPQRGTAVVNAGDTWAGRMTRDCRASVVRCLGPGVPGAEAARSDRDPLAGGDAGAWRVEVTRASMDGMVLRLRGAWRGQSGARVETLEVRTRLVGAFNAMNALQAAAACHALGVPAEAIVRALERASAPPGRLEPVTPPGAPFAVLVDYAHTDDALRKALQALRPLLPADGRLRVVFGCGGDRDRSKRPRMGQAAAELADHAVLTSDNPRTEEPGGIIAEVIAGVPAALRAKVAVEPDRARAIAAAVRAARRGDAVLIAGKGHEREQILPDGRGGTVRLPFDDREHARRALAGCVPGLAPAEVKPAGAGGARAPAGAAGRTASP